MSAFAQESSIILLWEKCCNNHYNCPSTPSRWANNLYKTSFSSTSLHPINTIHFYSVGAQKYKIYISYSFINGTCNSGVFFGRKLGMLLLSKKNEMIVLFKPWRCRVWKKTESQVHTRNVQCFLMFRETRISLVLVGTCNIVIHITITKFMIRLSITLFPPGFFFLSQYYEFMVKSMHLLKLFFASSFPLSNKDTHISIQEFDGEKKLPCCQLASVFF